MADGVFDEQDLDAADAEDLGPAADGNYRPAARLLTAAFGDNPAAFDVAAGLLTAGNRMTAGQLVSTIAGILTPAA